MTETIDPELSVEAVVVAFESADALPACLAAIAENGVRALVVDNASRDGSAELAERAGARVIRLSRNEGYGRANNSGVATSRAAFVLILNPDIVLEPDAVRELLAAAARYPDAALLAPRIIERGDRFFYQARSLLAPYLPNPGGRLSLPEGDCCAPFLSGACLLVRRSVFMSVGGFDPAIVLFYEDDDLCRRVAGAGHALVHVYAAVSRHGRGRSSAPRPGRVFDARWHLAWSRAYVSAKWGLPDPTLRDVVLNGLKAAGAALLFRRGLVERYAGAAAGAWAFRRGRTATERQGLDASEGP